MSELVLIPFFLMLSYVIGWTIEQDHFRSLRRREEATKHQPFLAESLHHFKKPIKFSELAVSEVVIGGDFFRHFWANLRNIFGGHLTAYESLKDRAQREAILRIKESHPEADYFINAKVETVNISSTMAEVIVYVTVIYLEK